MLQKLLFTKGIDSDTSPEVFQEGFGRYRLNVRVMTSDTEDQQSAETVKGNMLVNYILPIGDNTVIGSYEDLLQRKNYYFVYNSQNYHSVLEYDQVLNNVNIVFGGVTYGSFLNFNKNYLITGINTFKFTDTSHLLYWTDNYNQPRKINIEKGKYFMLGNHTLGYKLPFNPLILNRIKQAPLCEPNYSWLGGNFNTRVVTANYNGSTTKSQNQPTKIPFTQNPVTPAFINATNTFLVQQTGIYNLSATINITYISGLTIVVLKKNGVAIFQYQATRPVIPTVNFISTPNLSLNAGDTLVWVIYTSGPSVTFSNATFKADLITAQLNQTPNYLLNKLYRFKYRYVYDDGERSAFSPISTYVYPSVLMDSQTEDSVVGQNDQITIQIDTGISIVEKIEIAAKELNETAFNIIATIDKRTLGLADSTPYFYDYFGNGVKLPIVANDDIKLFDNVPLLSQAQENLKGERLADAFVTEGFDPVNIAIKIDLSYPYIANYIPYGATEHYPTISFPKSGGDYILGIVYYNESNQSGVTNIKDFRFDQYDSNTASYGSHLYIPFINDPNYGVQRVDYVPNVDMSIYNAPPDWATHYQIVRTKNLAYLNYLQFVINEVEYLDINGVGTTAALATRVRVNFTNIYGSASTSYKSINADSILDPPIYQGQTRIRFIANRSLTDTLNPGSYLSYNDSIITKWNESGTGKAEIIIPSGNSVLRQLNDGALCEMYNSAPSTTSENLLTYECGACYPIQTDINGYKYHVGNLGNQTYNNSGQTVTPAIVNLTGWDSFRRRQYMPHLGAPLYAEYFVESSNVNNMFYSAASNEGRPNRVDPEYRRITRPSTIYYSELFVPETFINGLSSVYDTNFETYEQRYGGIYKLYNKDQELKVFQETKIGSVLVQQVTFNDYKGNDTVGASPSVLANQIIYYSGEYGIGKHPESFAVYGNSIYGVDVRRGIVWRLANDGVTPISEYGQHIYFTGVSKKILQSSQKVKIYGVYDKRFNEYVISIAPFHYNNSGVVIDVPGQTLAFNENNNLWSTFYSYIPENMVSNGVGIITFKGGELWKHNENSIQNNFYGVQYSSELDFYCNFEPSKIKVFEAISLEGKDGWDTIIETPITQENLNGQHTELFASNYQMKEGFQYSDILKDDFTPNVLNPRFEGNPMRGKYALVKLMYNGTSFTKLFAANIQFITSERSNF